MSRDNVIKVVVAGNAPSVKGGITSVISQIMSHEWDTQGIVMKHITTFSGGNAVNKIMTFIKGYNQIKKECKSGGVDVVHIHMSHNGSFDRKFLIHKLCKKYGIPDIIHLHSSEFVKFYEKSPDSKKKKIRSLLSECSCVIALGKEWEQRVKRIAPDAKIRIMNNTVHIPEHCTEQPEDKIGFLYMGVLVKRKGVIDLLKAVSALEQKGLLKKYNVSFNIGGTGECEQELKAFVRDHSLTEYVRFLGWINGEEKIRQLSSNQVLILPSYNEGLPIAVLEAISFGMPVISSDVGSVSEAVHNGVNGFLYKAGDIPALTECIEKIITASELRLRMAKESRKLAETAFSDTEYFNELEKLYRKMAK